LSAGGAGDERGDDVGGVPVEGLAAPVVSHRRSRVGVASGLLHVAQRHAGVQTGGGGDEGVTQRVRSDPLADPRTASDTSHDPPGGVTVEALAIDVEEIGPSTRSPTAKSTARATRGASGIVTSFPPLRNTVSVRWPRSRPSASMLAPIASDTRSPFNASSDTNA
jgi:hypothetical protein